MSETKAAVVTAASRGMGRAIAEELAARGYKLAIMATSEEVENLAERLGAIAIRGSVTEAADLERLVETAYAAHGRLDAVVNNTGHPPKGDLLEISDQDWYAGMDMVFLNVVRTARLVTPIMEAQGGGAIVNISTFGAFEPSPDFPVSVALRAALAGFTKLYADRYAAANIRMNNLLPGFIDSYPENEDIRARIPMGRYGHVDEIAKTTAFLLSEDAGYITGQNIRADGGLSRGL